MVEPTSLTGFELPLALQKTHDGEQFFVHDSGLQPELDTLSSSDDWFCEGTFLLPMYSIKLIQDTLLFNDALFLFFTLCYPTKKSIYCRLLSILTKSTTSTAEAQI